MLESEIYELKLTVIPRVNCNRNLISTDAFFDIPQMYTSMNCIFISHGKKQKNMKDSYRQKQSIYYSITVQINTNMNFSCRKH